MEYEWDDIDVDYLAEYLARINEMQIDYFDQQVLILAYKFRGKKGIKLPFINVFYFFYRIINHPPVPVV